MPRHLSCDGTRFHLDGQPVRAADLQPGDTYTLGNPRDRARTVTVTGAPYADQVHTLQDRTVDVVRIPVQLADGTQLHDTASPDKGDLL